MTRPVTRPVIARDALGTLTKLGQGGQGIVYQAPKAKTKFADAMVFKEYKPHARTNVSFDALSAMPTLVEDTLSDHDGHALVSIAAWPCAPVETSTGPVGFVMPAIPDSFYIDLTTVKGVSRTTAEFQHLLNPPSVLAARGITITDTQRYQLLRAVAKALSFLHRIGVCVGDISPKNLLFSLTPQPAVYFIDCDAMRVNGVSVLPQMETPEWDVPAGEELATIHSDTYKLGLLALRLLIGDQHTKDIQQLPSTTPKLLRQLITDTLANEPHRRPLPEAWTYLLGHTLEEVQHRAPTPPTPTPLKPAPPTHVPEPQPVVRSRPAATPGENRVAATVSPSPTPASTQPATQSILKSPRTIIRVAAAAFIVFVIVLIAHAISSNGGSSPTTADQMSGTYTVRDVGEDVLTGHREWTITPCGANCVDVVAGRGTGGSKPYQGRAHASEGRWSMNFIREDGMGCSGGGDGPLNVTYTWDASSLKGSWDGTIWNNACGQPTGSDSGPTKYFTLTKVH